ncbi:MAG: hypothetical protein WD401_05600 [Thermomicrobiaceae bacterium]
MPPSVLFTIVLALTLGFLFHSVFGRYLWQLPCFLISAVVGVFAGQVLSVLTGTGFMIIGNVAVILASAGAVVVMGMCWFFTAPIEQSSSDTRRRARRVVSREERASA